MSFAFNLGGDDIDLDDEDVPIISKNHETFGSLETDSTSVKIYTIGDNYLRDVPTLSLLAGLPSSISYESVEVPHKNQNLALQPQASDRAFPGEHQDTNSVLRRPTFDILLQLKAEADPEANRNRELISAMEGNDRQSGVYEGGLKTWEGALDLAALVKDTDFASPSGSWHILELGAGSAIPSMLALKRIFGINHDMQSSAEPKQYHFTLSDYNDEVLRLSTFANVVLASHEELNRRQIRRNFGPSTGEGSIDVDEHLVRECHEVWRQSGVSFSFISGPWGKDFAVAASAPALEGTLNVLILASETIYDLKSLPIFTDTVMSILRAHGVSARAWVAAKTLYFGVGGGVDAFVQEVNLRGGAVREIMHIKQGVSRVVLEVRNPSTTDDSVPRT